MDSERELLEQVVEAWNANDWDALMALFSDDVVIIPPFEWPESEIARGLDGARGSFERLKSSWVEERVEITELETDGEKPLLGWKWVTLGAASGAPVETQLYAVYDISADGEKVTRGEFFTDRALAFSAAGLKT